MSKDTFSTPISKEEFHVAIALNRIIIFEVNYYTFGKNKYPHFSTLAFKFNQPKTDWSEGGQAQDRLCFGPAKKFYLKWNKCHCKDMTDEEYYEMRKDLNELLKVFSYYIIKVQEPGEGELIHISFYQKKELSMKIPYKFNYKKHLG